MHVSPWGSLSTIRVRLTAALAAALLPVLVLGVVQSGIAFRRESVQLREELAAASERSAATARARMEAADILLETLAPGSVGFNCAQRLAEVTARIPGYSNLIRFDRRGRVACAAGNVPADPIRATRPWFQSLAAGDSLVITREPGASYANVPALLAAVPATDSRVGFDGGLVAVISLESLAPRTADRSLPEGAEVALVDGEGGYINATDKEAFPDLPTDWREKAQKQGSLVWYDRDLRGKQRVFSAAPLVGDQLYVVLSAQSGGLFSWATLNPLTSIVFPILTFILALVAVSVVTGLGFGWLANLSDSGASVQWTSPPTAVGLTAELVGRIFGAQWTVVPATRILGLAVLAVALVALWWQARGGDPPRSAGLALAATVALAPVFHPWYAIWPQAVLGATVRRETRWLVVPAAVAAALCLPDGYNLALATRVQGAVAMTVLVGVLAARRWRGRRAVPA